MLKYICFPNKTISTFSSNEREERESERERERYIYFENIKME